MISNSRLRHDSPIPAIAPIHTFLIRRDRILTVVWHFKGNTISSPSATAITAAAATRKFDTDTHFYLKPTYLTAGSSIDESKMEWEQ